MSDETKSPVDTPRADEGEAPSLEDELARLRNDVENLKTESKSWVKTWGVYLGMLGALIAVPKEGLDLVTKLWQRTDTSVVIRSIKITHDPNLLSEIVQFPLLIMNVGNRDDALLERNAKLTVNGASVELKKEDFGLFDNDKKIETPLLVPKDALRAYEVSVTFDANTREKAAKQGLHKLELSFPGVNKSYFASYCFTLSDDDVNTLFKSNQTEITSLSSTPCPNSGSR